MGIAQAAKNLYNSKIYPKILNTCKNLGEHNSPLYAVLAIAVFKGIMRPTFTMMDKKSDKETKKYAAFREGVTEIIAFCSYIVTHKLFDLLTPVIAKKTGKSPKKVANGLSLFSVCVTAGVLIPAICNVTLKPIMNLAQKIGDKKKKSSVTDVKLDVKENAVDEKINPTTFSAVYSPKLSDNSKNLLNVLNASRVQNSGMKVGG